MYISEVLNCFNEKVEFYLFPFMAQIGYDEYKHTKSNNTDAYSKYDFIKGDDYISVSLGLNRMDYNDGIQVSLYNLSGVRQSLKDLINDSEADLFFDYSKDEVDNSMKRIKDCLTRIFLA